MNARPLLVALLFFTLVLAGCNTASSPASQQENASPAPDKIKVYTSIYPLYDFAGKIGGDKIELINLVPAGAEPHDFEPSTRQIAEISKAELFIYNGAGLEHYLDTLKEALKGTPIILVNTSAGLDLLKSEHEDEDEHHDHEQEAASLEPHDEEHDHGGLDPHIWLSPGNAGKQGEAIMQALTQIDPGNQEFYEKNYASFKAELVKLDNEYRDTLSKCKKKDIVVSHQAFGYLARDYGLNQIPVRGLNAEAEPTPGKMKEIINTVKEHDIKYIFFESLISPKVSEAIAREVQAETLVLNPIGGLTEKELQAGQDYFSIMRENLANLQTALEYQP